MNHPKLRSTTFWLTLIVILLNPIAWVTDYLMRKDLIQYIIEQGITDLSTIDRLIVQLPLPTIATAAVTVITAYVAGNKVRGTATNLTLPQGQNGLNDNNQHGS